MDSLTHNWELFAKGWERGGSMFLLAAAIIVLPALALEVLIRRKLRTRKGDDS